MSNHLKLFETKIYQANFKSSNAFNDDLLREVEVLKVDDQAGIKWSKINYPNGYTSYASANQMHQTSPTFSELEKKIRLHVLKYLKSLKLKVPSNELQMTTCWVNVMNQGCTHPLHIHPKSIVSGTYYLSVPQGASAIRFEDPRYGLFMNRPPQQTHFSLQAKKGDLILFESWLRHDVPLNTSREPRISVSFNY